MLLHWFVSPKMTIHSPVCGDCLHSLRINLHNHVGCSKLPHTCDKSSGLPVSSSHGGTSRSSRIVIMVYQTTYYQPNSNQGFTSDVF